MGIMRLAWTSFWLLCWMESDGYDLRLDGYLYGCTDYNDISYDAQMGMGVVDATRTSNRDSGDVTDMLMMLTCTTLPDKQHRQLPTHLYAQGSIARFSSSKPGFLARPTDLPNSPTTCANISISSSGPMPICSPAPRWNPIMLAWKYPI